VKFRIWILGLKSHYRGSTLELALNTQKLEFSNFWGFDAKELYGSNKIGYHDINFANFLYGRNLLTTEIAASLGHIGIYKEFLKSKHSWALILEDDAIINFELSNLLVNLEDYNKPVVINLSHGEGFRFKKQALVGRNFKTKNYEVVRLLELPTLAHGYLINRKAVEMIDFKLAQKLITVPDWPYIWPKSFQYYVTRVSLVSADNANTESLIGDRTGLPSTPPSFWLPSIRRSIIAYKFGVNLQLAFYREFVIKILRIYYRLIQLIKSLLW
jgi:GR25 family glycosyltransferase involved in LPS biosynthesis